MRKIDERSFGIVPIQYQKSGIHVFLVQHISQAWLLPKGHAEEGEGPKEASVRELFEETHLQIVRWFDMDPFVEHYTFQRAGKDVYKEVLYFAAEVEGNVVLQSEEVLSGKWVKLEQLEDEVTFPEMKEIARVFVQTFH